MMFLNVCSRGWMDFSEAYKFDRMVVWVENKAQAYDCNYLCVKIDIIVSPTFPTNDFDVTIL